MITHYLRGLLGYCPHCGKARWSKGLVGIHAQCSNCGLKFQSAPGDFTGAAVLSYGVTSFPILMLGMLLVAFTDLSLMSIMAIGVVLTLIIGTLTYQPLKGLWIAFLVDNGAIAPPDSITPADFSDWTGERHL
jgi:uncharacterized protein (DUF983 family)